MTATSFVTKRFVGANQVAIAGDEGGDMDASTVVLLHGGGQTRQSWSGAMRHLIARGYHVINLDLRGHGESDWASDGDYTLDAYAADLDCVLRTLRSPAALVGASLGGATALLWTGTHAQQAASALVLVDIVPRMDEAGAAKILGFMRSGAAGFATLSEAADAVAAYNPLRPRPQDASGLTRNLRRRGDGRLYWHWDPRLIAPSADAEPNSFAKRLTAAAAGVRIPTLLVRGMLSDIVTEEGIADLRRRIPQLEVCSVSGAGHMVAGDRNDAFNDGVFGFLNRHVPLGGGC